MLERVLFEYYRIYPDVQMYIGDDMVVVSEGKQYLVRAVDPRITKKLEEIRTMGDWLIYYGEKDIATIMERQDRKLSFKLDEQFYVVFQLPPSKKKNDGDVKLGKRLAIF